MGGNEHIGKILYIGSGDNAGTYTVISNTINILTLDRDFLTTETGVNAKLNTPLNWNTSDVSSTYSWAIAGAVTNDTITFSSIHIITGSSNKLQQNGIENGSFGAGTLYRIIRRRI